MTNAPRRLLNRILLATIGCMTLAIFTLATAMIYLFLTGDTEDEGAASTLGAILEAAHAEGRALYRIPSTCPARVSVDEGQVTVFLFQPGCRGAQVISTEGAIAIAYPLEQPK